jgi:hypothetical protein
MAEKEVRLIDANALVTEIERIYFDHYEKSVYQFIHDFFKAMLRRVRKAPTIDPESLRPHGKWELETHWFYRDTFDESKELVVYITASCSECSCKHPNNYEVFSKTLYEPEDADDDFLFDEEKEVSNALDEFELKQHIFVSYCPNCGAKMEV